MLDSLGKPTSECPRGVTSPSLAQQGAEQHVWPPRASPFPPTPPRTPLWHQSSSGCKPRFRSGTPCCESSMLVACHGCTSPARRCRTVTWQSRSSTSNSRRAWDASASCARSRLRPNSATRTSCRSTQRVKQTARCITSCLSSVAKVYVTDSRARGACPSQTQSESHTR